MNAGRQNTRNYYIDKTQYRARKYVYNNLNTWFEAKLSSLSEPSSGTWFLSSWCFLDSAHWTSLTYPSNSLESPFKLPLEIQWNTLETFLRQTWKKARTRGHCSRKLLRIADIFWLWKIMHLYFQKKTCFLWKCLIKHLIFGIFIAYKWWFPHNSSFCEKFIDTFLRKF